MDKDIEFMNGLVEKKDNEIDCLKQQLSSAKKSLQDLRDIDLKLQYEKKVNEVMSQQVLKLCRELVDAYEKGYNAACDDERMQHRW
jgi:hypothetical protein